MYRALIADDEEIIRRGIASFLKRDSEIEVVAQAEDGEEALELARKYKPDLLFVDINMPFLNGLEFIEAITKELTNSLIIIITGYDDFNYVQKALRLQVFDYQLKPIMEEPFFEMLDRAKGRLKYMVWAQDRRDQKKSQVIADFLYDWLSGKNTWEQAEQTIHYLNLCIPEPAGITLFRYVEVGGCEELRVSWDNDLLLCAIENISQEIYEPLGPVFSCRNEQGDLIMLSGCMPQDAWERAGNTIEELIKKHLQVDIDIVQKTCDDCLEVSKVYNEVLDEANKMSECSDLIRRIKQYIEDKCFDEDFSLQEAADFAHISPQHLSRVFRNEVGVTFMDYITGIRIKKAKELLRDTDMKIYNVAQRVGYSTQHYFSNVFKRVLGISPLDYRKKEQKEQKQDE